MVEHVAQEIEVRAHVLPYSTAYDPAVTAAADDDRARSSTATTALLLDVYGVLMDARGPLPGAAELLAELERRGTPYAIVTNDASRIAGDLRRAVRAPRHRGRRPSGS